MIDPAKLREYLLSASHPVGRFKAAFFATLGYSAENWQQLETDLRRQHLTLAATLREATPYGRKYEIRGTLTGPSGRATQVVSIWIIPSGAQTPRFVTAYPGGPR